MHMNLHLQSGAFPDQLPPARHFRTRSPPVSTKPSLHLYFAVESNVCFFTLTFPFKGFSRSGHFIAVWRRWINQGHAHTIYSNKNNRQLLASIVSMQFLQMIRAYRLLGGSKWPWFLLKEHYRMLISFLKWRPHIKEGRFKSAIQTFMITKHEQSCCTQD